MEQTVQAQWEREATFSADAVEDGRPKFFVTFPRGARVRERAAPDAPRTRLGIAVTAQGRMQALMAIAAAMKAARGKIHGLVPEHVTPRLLIRHGRSRRSESHAFGSAHV